MKLKSGFVLHSVGGEHVVVAVEERTAEFRGMIRLNDTGAFLWSRLADGADGDAMCAALLKEYSVTAETAEAAVSSFLEKLQSADILEP